MEKITPTPWRVFVSPDGRRLVGIGGQDGQGILDCGFGVWAWDEPEGIANANLVIEAVNSHASLKARVEELEGYLRSEIKELEGRHPGKFLQVAMGFESQLWQRLTAALQPKDAV